ncbi:MAG: hypothetical protein AB1921_18295 [Thermodesulfobacteriota bacterium]
MLFQPIIDSNDFPRAVMDLAAPMMRDFGLPRPGQLGLVVPDVEAAARDLEKQGIGPFFIAEGPVFRWTERGGDRTFSGKLGLARHRGLDLELLEPGTGSDFYGRALDPEGRIVLHHLGFFIKSVEPWEERIRGKGVDTWVRGSIRKGPVVAEFAYMDSVATHGLVCELIDQRFFGFPAAAPPAFLLHGAGFLQKALGRRSIKT